MSSSNFCQSALALLVSTTAAFSSPVIAKSEEDTAERERRDQKSSSEDIVVTGRSLDAALSSPLPVQLLSGPELAHRRQGGLGETLAGLPGVHLDNFGGGASRPVIRGQTVPRIEILSDGANLFDVSSVSPDHAVTTDPLLLDEIEILRGPAATRYGGNAVNGAINLIDGRVPKALPDGGMSGATEVRFGTGDAEKTVVGRVTAGLGSFAFHAEGSRRRSDDYDVPDAYGSDKLRDSFADSSSYSLGASWITSKGYVGAAYTRNDSEYGLPGHSHEGGVCHLHGVALHCESHGSFTDPFLASDDRHTAFIRLRSERLDVRGDYEDLLPGIAHARLRLSYTDYAHNEIDGETLFSRYSTKVYDGRLELTHAPILGFSGSFGVQYTHSTFSGLDYNDAHEGHVPLNFVTEGRALFVAERRSFGALEVEVSARKDWREIRVPFLLEYFVNPVLLATLTPAQLEMATKAYSQVHPRNWPSSKAAPFSASIASTLRLGEGYSASLSVSRSERMPGVREIYASSNSLATNSYETGLIKGSGGLQKYPDVIESTKAVNLTLRKASGPTQFEIGLFYQDVDDYVFAKFLDEQTLGSGGLYRYLVYTPVDARFIGLDGQISHQIDRASRLTLFGDYVRADLKDDSANLPRIPPGRLGVRYDYYSGPISANAEYFRTFGQERIASYETRTAGYDMLNATLAYRFEMGGGKKSVELYIRGSNLSNQWAFAHTSFVKDQSPLRDRSVAIGMRHSF